MMQIHEVNEELNGVSESIQKKTHELEAAREVYLLAEAKYENEFAMYERKCKVEYPDMTQTDIKAEATNRSYNARIDLIKAECVFKKLMNEIKALRDRLEALREVSYNLRMEAKL